MVDNVKRIPYGISDFKQLRRENLYYVDKTMYLQRLEDAGHFLFFIRPRRFGKSLLLNMLAAYYDIVAQIRGYEWLRVEEIEY